MTYANSATTRRPVPLAILMAFVVCLSACAELPKSFRVDIGSAPKHADNDVRFRTTYFFRVFDYCYDVKAAQKSLPVADSLYRFVMSGKSNPYANTVKFESGTLTSAQIDPFGATVEPDKTTGRPRFVSQREAQERAARDSAQESIESLIALRERLTRLNAEAARRDPAGKTVDDTILAALDQQIAASVTSSLGVGRLQYDKTELRASGRVPNPDLCPPGTEIERGFQIMGPQGVRTFNQDERLLMAMSTTSTGLLDSLSQLSGRVLEAKGSKLRDSDALLALVREQLRVSELRRISDNAGTPEKAEALDATIDKLTERLESNRGVAP